MKNYYMKYFYKILKTEANGQNWKRFRKLVKGKAGLMIKVDILNMLCASQISSFGLRWMSAVIMKYKIYILWFSN